MRSKREQKSIIEEKITIETIISDRYRRREEIYKNALPIKAMRVTGNAGGYYGGLPTRCYAGDENVMKRG